MMLNDDEAGRGAIGTRSERRRWMSVALVVTAQFMVILDVTIVNVALPSIQRDLGFAQENLQWVITAYTIMFGATLLLGGRLADLLGRRGSSSSGSRSSRSARCSVGSLGRRAR
jgi:MFS family permease